MQKHNENTTLSLFIFRSNIKGMQYGIGTYIHELTQALMRFPEIKIYIVSYKNHECKEFSMRILNNRISEIMIPSLLFIPKQIDSFEKKYASIIVRFLHNLIPKNGKVIFQMNHLDDLPIIIKLKELYKYPVISVIHFAQWQIYFYGNKQKLKGLQIDQPSHSFEFPLFFEKRFCMISDHVVSVTQYMKDFLITQYGIPQGKITVIKNGLDLNKYSKVSKAEKVELRQKLGFRNDEIILLFSGRIDVDKGIFPLLEAFEEACQRNSNLRLVIIGYGRIQDCHKKIQSNFGKVTFTGFLLEEKVLSFYKIADIGIAPSIYDQCPYSVIEMMASKIPLILSKTSGLDELLSNEECFFVNPLIDTDGEITIDISAL